MRKIITVLTASLFFLLYGAQNVHAGLSLTQVSVLEQQGEAYPSVTYEWGGFGLSSNYSFAGYKFSMETDSYGVDINWGQELSDSRNSFLNIRLMTPLPEIERTGGYWRGFAGVTQNRWFIPWDSTIPAYFGTDEITAGVIYNNRLIDTDTVNLTLGLEGSMGFLGALHMGEASDGSITSMGGYYSIISMAGAINLQLEVELTPQTTFFTSAEYAGTYYWHGSLFTLIIFYLDSQDVDGEIDWEYEASDPYGAVGYRRLTMGFRHKF